MYSRDWFEKAKRKEESGLTGFYYLYKKELFAYILKRIFCYEDAEDLLSVVLEKIFLNFHKIFSIHTLNSYVYRITKNEIAEYYRKKKRKNQITELTMDKIELESKYDSPRDLLAKKETILLVRSAMLKLPAREFEMLKLFYDENKTVKEISKISGASPRSVESLLYRGKKRLGKLLNSHHMTVKI